MAEKILNSRLKLKCDTFENWQKTNVAGKGANLILKEGEIGICFVSSNGTISSVLLKVGDGKNTYADLPWASGLAADVYDWAKAVTKPNYSYNELSDLPIHSGTREYWNSHTSFIGNRGDIIIYEDYKTITEGSVIKNIPGFKVCDGLAYVVDLPFATALYDNHLDDMVAHITSAEREK